MGVADDGRLRKWHRGGWGTANNRLPTMCIIIDAHHPGPTFDCCVGRPALLLYAARHGRIVVRGAAPGRTIVHGDVKTMSIAHAGL